MERGTSGPDPEIGANIGNAMARTQEINRLETGHESAIGKETGRTQEDRKVAEVRLEPPEKTWLLE
jgi:hypothetical protein